MVIDFHTHILPPSFRDQRRVLRERDATFAGLFKRDNAPVATAEELVAAMDKDGVATSVVQGYGWSDQTIARESNDYLLEAAVRFPGRLVPFCSVNPVWGDDAAIEVERCVAHGARGIGELHPTTQGLDLANEPYLDPVMTLAQQHGLPVVVHGSEPVGHTYDGKGDVTPDKLLSFINRYPGATIVCAHWGGGLLFYELMPEVRKALVNVYFDTAATSFLYRRQVFPTAIQAAGAEKLLFGSDYPLLSARRVVNEAKAALQEAGLDDSLQQAILHDNAARLLMIGA